jgi:hypothetical protein
MAKLQQLAHKIDPIDRAVSSAVGLNFAPKTVLTPQVLAMPTDQDLTRAKQLAAAQALQRTGRASTILSQNSGNGDQLGA